MIPERSLNEPVIFKRDEWKRRFSARFNVIINEREFIQLKLDGSNIVENLYLVKNVFGFDTLLTVFNLNESYDYIFYSHRWSFYLVLSVIPHSRSIENEVIKHWNNSDKVRGCKKLEKSLFDYPYEENKSIYPEKRKKYHFLNIHSSEKRLFDCELSFQLDQNQNVTKTRYNLGFNDQNLKKFILNENVLDLRLRKYIAQLSLNNSTSFLLAWDKHLESLIKITPDERDEVLKMILLELDFIKAHIHFFNKNLYLFNAHHLKPSNDKLIQQLDSLIAAILGSPFNKKQVFYRFLQIPNTWLFDLQETLRELDRFWKKTLTPLHKSRLQYSFLAMGEISKDKALSSGLTGVNLQASGIKFDLRDSLDAYLYSEVDKKIFFGDMGTIWDRFFLRFQEIKQSINIIYQLVNYLPIKNNLNNNANDFKLADGKHYSAHNTPEGRFIVYTDIKDELITNIGFLSPGLSNTRAMDVFMREKNIEEIIPTLTSLNIDTYEVDN